MSVMSGSDPTQPPSAGVKLTYDDLVHFPDDGKRHELIDGEHYLTPSPNTRHQRIVLTLTNYGYPIVTLALTEGTSVPAVYVGAQ